MKKVQISGKACEDFEGNYWNAFNEHLAMSGLNDLTGIIRSAQLAYWYASEIANGGHGQYFCNKDYFNHDDVVKALKEISASRQADILVEAIGLNRQLEKPEITKK